MVVGERPPPGGAAAGAGIAVSGRAAFGPPAVIAAAFAPIVVLFGLGLWTRPHYQFFPLLVPGAALLARRSFRGLGPLEPGSAWLAWSAAAASWLLLAAGVATVTPWFAAIGALAALLGAAYALGGGRLARAALPAWGLLWLAIPLPRRYDSAMIAGLQDLVSRWSGTALDALGVYHVMDGNVVEVGGRELLVDQACSGIYSLSTLLAGTLFYAAWVRASPIRAVALAAASVFWVLFGNVLRIVAVVVLSTRWGVEAASGWRHEVLGLAAFGLMLALVLSTDRLLAFLGSLAAWAVAVFSPETRRRRRERQAEQMEAANRSLLLGAEKPSRPGEPAGEGPATPAGPGNAAEARTSMAPLGRTWVGSWAAAAAFGLLLPPQAMLPGAGWGDLLSSRVYEERFASVDAETMPDRLGAYRRHDFRVDRRDWDNSWGEHSRVWSYWGPSHAAAVSLDYSFVGWHELTACYRSRGWRTTSTRVEAAPVRPGGPEPSGGGLAMVSEFTNIEGRSGYLIYALYDRRGRPIAPPGTTGTIDRLRGRLASWSGGRDPVGLDGEVLSYQVQVFVGGEAPPTSAERAAIHALFAEARERVGRLARGSGEATP